MSFQLCTYRRRNELLGIKAKRENREPAAPSQPDDYNLRR